MNDPAARSLTARVALIAAVSGAAALAYEVGWARAFALQLGAEVPVFTGLLAGFLAGLALGGWLGGHLSARSRRPLALFAALEAGTAFSAILVLPALQWLAPLFSTLYRRHLETGASFLLPGVGLATLLVLPPTVLMGATFPALVEHLRRSGASTGRSCGLAYGANTGGAVAGALGTGLLALPLLGLASTLALAAACNLIAAGLAVRRLPAATPRPRPAPKAVSPGAGGALLAAVFLVGAASMVDQVGWTRTLSMLLGSTVYGFSLILAAFLSGLALGGLAGARLARQSRHLTRLLVLLYALVGLSSLLGLAVLGRLAVWLVPPLARAHAGLGWVMSLQFAAAFAVVAIPTFLMGAAFPLAVALRDRDRRGAGLAAGEVYAASSSGLVLGSLLAGGWLLPALGVRGALVAGALAMPVAALLVARCAPRGGLWRISVASLLLLVLTAWALPGWDAALVTSGPFLYAPLYRAGARAQDVSISDAIRGRGELLFHRDGADATVSVRRSPGDILSLQINGKTDASSGGDMVSQLLAGHLPALLAPPAAESALLIGLATGVSLGALETYPFRRLDVVELLPGVVEAAPLFDAASGNALDDPRVRLHLGDARNHLLYSGVTYDLITSQPTNPWVSGAAALFTREAFEAARDRLRDGGIFCQWVQGYGMRPEDLRSVVATFQGVFPQVSLWEASPAGGDYFLVGHKAASLVLDLELMEERMGDPRVRDDLARAGITDAVDILTRFVAGPDALRDWSHDAVQQVDDRTALEFTAARALYENTLPAVVRTLRRHRETPVPWIQPLGSEAEFSSLLSRLRAARTDARREERFLLSLGDAGAAALAHPELGLAIELLRAGLSGPARRHLERAATSPPAAAEAHALLGALLASSGERERARRELAQAIHLRSGDVASLALLARLDLDSGDREAARHHLQQARALHPGDPDLLNLAGVLHLLDDHPAQAIPLLLRSVQEDAGLAEAWVNLGVARRRSGDLPGAVEAYQRALQMDPDNPDARFNLAVGLALAGNGAAAAEELLHILRVDPADSSARLRLALVYRDDHRFADARRELQILIAEFPGSAEVAAAQEALANL